MTISDLCRRLESLRAIHGDLPVTVEAASKLADREIEAVFTLADSLDRVVLRPGDYWLRERNGCSLG
jgi:hypothetical protein